MLPASHRVDLERIEQILNTDVRMVTESEMKSLFPDCEVGAEPPFGSQFGLRTLVDEHLAQQERIAIRGATPGGAPRLRTTRGWSGGGAFVVPE